MKTLSRQRNHLMALLYALICSWAVVLRNFAARKHNRHKQTYTRIDNTFCKLEQECKSHEVAIGGPADYGLQMKLLRLFDDKEKAREQWIASHNRLLKRKLRLRKLRKFSGRKLPYTFGLFDMAILFKAVDFGQRFADWNLSAMIQTLQSWI